MRPTSSLGSAERCGRIPSSFGLFFRFTVTSIKPPAVSMTRHSLPAVLWLMKEDSPQARVAAMRRPRRPTFVCPTA